MPNRSLDKILFGTFALGFFRPENSTKYFFGIWYNTIPDTPVVWVANRESPLDSPGVFMLSGDGNLVVLDGMTRKLIWSSNASVPASAMKATTGLLMDSGNLELRYKGNILWQSFDHPFDTMLPGMKLSVNKRTSKQGLLTSWSALGDPRPGKFTAGIDPKVPRQIITWKENATYWKSAVYFGKDAKTYFRNPSGTFFFIAHNIDIDEIYFSYGVSDNSVILRSVLNPNGMLVLLLWQWKDDISTWRQVWGEPENKCDFYARCGPDGACDKNSNPLSSQCKCLKSFRIKFHKQWAMRDWPGGCVREKALTCDKGEGFSKFERMKLPDHSVLLGNKSTRECESECLKKCSCTAYAYSNVTEGSTTSCLAWFGDLMDLVENHGLGQTIYICVHRSNQDGKGHGDKRTLVIAIVSATAGLFTIIFGYFLWKKTLREDGRIGGRKSQTLSNISAGGGNNDTELPLFDLRSILAATDNFSEANKLGEGGFGPVYKGTLLENQDVAIKRLSKKSGQGHQEFMNELKLIAKLQHTNLVRLLGCCIEDEEMILIYEYMPNRSLDKILFEPSENTKLDWGKRFRIIEGIAQGLLYIHKYSRLKIIHRDLKASNVLLDGTMNPKISDFGMARIFEINEIEANTKRVVGTYGYMSPEYALFGHFSEKLDVFSFGVLLLEIVSGKRNAAFYSVEHSQTLAGWAWELWKEGRGLEMIDASVRETYQPHEALRCIHVGLLCVQEADRPTMSSVIHMLQSNEASSLPPTKEPAFSRHRNSSAVGSSSQTSASFSNNVVTISMPEGR
ncbi:G-type lectin S-receptor-like serine/threonine-protein kinase At1g11330 isoform X2 [Prunus avium]|uniref:Receptor-like serine/threonine-protein kinase n=1 Tax=Prunus avium TaxID=42229 RepID=A0A6P5SPL5_PRUAV|nr:G-type lectin S-receptor-like serine/threonine-protein kinase At1g11330 isoform X2 [Prunus avium]